MKTKTQKQKPQQQHKRHKKNSSQKVIHVKMKHVQKTNEKPMKPDPVLLAKYTETNKPQIKTKSEIVQVFLETLTSIRLYHWKTKSYSQHKATDQLYEELEEKVDEFVEVMQGKMIHPNRVQWMNDKIKADSPDTKKGMVNRYKSCRGVRRNPEGS